MVVLCTALGVRAEKYAKTVEKQGAVKQFLKTQIADCNAAEAQVEMSINNVRTIILAGGDMWWDLNNARYEVPKIPLDDPQVSVSALFAGSVWISGEDDGGNLKLAAQTYRQGGNDYWPGPLNSQGNIGKETCREWDRHFSVFGSDIDKPQTTHKK